MKKLLWLALIIFVPCIAQETSNDLEFIEIDNTTVPVVYDEFGNPYMKQKIGDDYIYMLIPTESEDLQKSKPHAKRSRRSSRTSCMGRPSQRASY